MWLRSLNGYLNSDNIESISVVNEGSTKFFIVAKMRSGEKQRVWQSSPTEEEKELLAVHKADETRVLVERRRLNTMKLMKGVVAMLSDKDIQELKDEVAKLADEIFEGKKGKAIERKAKKGE
jgi:hypothetical protein